MYPKLSTQEHCLLKYITRNLLIILTAHKQQLINHLQRLLQVLPRYILRCLLGHLLRQLCSHLFHTVEFSIECSLFNNYIIKKCRSIGLVINHLRDKDIQLNYFLIEEDFLFLLIIKFILFWAENNLEILKALFKLIHLQLQQPLVLSGLIVRIFKSSFRFVFHASPFL